MHASLQEFAPFPSATSNLHSLASSDAAHQGRSLRPVLDYDYSSLLTAVWDASREFSEMSVSRKASIGMVFDDASSRIVKQGAFAPMLLDSASVMRPCDADATGMQINARPRNG